MQLEARSPATGERLGAVEQASTEDVLAAAARAAAAQRVWAAVPAPARARYVRRAARLMLDDLDELALLLARETGHPRTEAALGELLPTVAGLSDLADDGPAALADRRLGRPALLRAGRRAVSVQEPRGVVGVLGSPDSPWTEPALEVAASLLAGNGVVLAPAAPLAGERLRAALLRAGIPAELLAVVHGDAARAALPDACARVVSLEGPATKGALLVLEGAPVEQVASAALWAAFAAGGRHPAAAGRLVCVPSVAEPLLGLLRERALRLEVGDPVSEQAEVGPLRSPEDLAAVEALVEEAVSGGAELICGGPVQVEGLSGPFYAPAVLRRVPAGARILREPAPGPVLAVVEAAGEAAAIELVQDRPMTGDRRARGGVVSVWARDRAKGDRVARTLEAELTWVNEHGAVAPGPALRLQRHTAARQVASRTAVIGGGARRLPYDPGLVRARTAVTRLVHGRESDRLAVIRRDAGPLARAALRVGTGLLRRR